MNNQIRVPQVRVIGEDGKQMGILDTREAVTRAEAVELDLVEVSPDARPPVCKIMDYGKYKYEQSKRVKESRKKQHVMQLKEIRFKTPKITDHDLEYRAEQAREFLSSGNKVKVSVRFWGREMAHIELGQQRLDKMSKMLEDIATLEQTPKLEGRSMSLVLMPK
ncbi:MAG: translation initiation factor IF-3 [candidate division Zixibacteria bacterium]|nr:translation initiation factor IF-3 [candidate division Zixibacteria bacterium]